MVQNANGTFEAYRAALDSVTNGDVMLHQVNAVVIEAGLNTALLGMSFLSRTKMKRDPSGMVLAKRV